MGFIGTSASKLSFQVAMAFLRSITGCTLHAACLSGLLLWVPLAQAAPGNGHELLAVGAQFGRVFERAPDGRFVGLGVDVLRAIARQTGDSVRFQIYPWARAQAMVEHGSADILIGPYKTPARAQRFAFAERPFYQDQMVFYERGDDTINWRGDYAALKGLHIAAVNGWVYGDAFDLARAGLGVTNTDTLENGIMMLTHGRIDLLATNLRNTQVLLSGFKLTGSIKPAKTIIEVQNGYFAFGRGIASDGLRLRFNRAFNSLVDKGELARLARAQGVAVP